MAEQTEQFQIGTAADLRRVMAEAIVGVMEGRVSVPQANAVAALATEVHKSIRQEWDMRVYMVENLTYQQAQFVRRPVDGQSSELLPQTPEEK